MLHASRTRHARVTILHKGKGREGKGIVPFLKERLTLRFYRRTVTMQTTRLSTSSIRGSQSLPEPECIIRKRDQWSGNGVKRLAMNNLSVSSSRQGKQPIPSLMCRVPFASTTDPSATRCYERRPAPTKWHRLPQRRRHPTRRLSQMLPHPCQAPRGQRPLGQDHRRRHPVALPPLRLERRRQAP